MKPSPVLGTTHADFLPGPVPCTAVIKPEKIQIKYEEETGLQIISAFQKLDYREIPMVLVACHGPFTWGKSAKEAVYHSVMLEELARMALMTLFLNPETPPLQKALIRKHFGRKHGLLATYGQKKKPIG
jgi:L-ribulose-5-phosphate 4-epimerase